jgi:invasion protein IalB
MNLPVSAASVRPRGRLLALLAASALVVCSGLDASAQAPAPAPAPAPKAKKAAPKAAPAPAPAQAQAPAQQPPAAGQPQPPAGQPQPPAGQQAQEGPQLIYAPWTKFCVKGDPNAKQICFTGKDGRIESGQPVIAAVVIEPEGEPKKILRVTLPLGMALAHGTRIVVDANPPQQSGYSFCFSNGCVSDYDASPELINSLKTGKQLAVQAITANQQALTLMLPLSDFGKAYDGPPTDPKVFEETQKKLQEELQKRAEEARKKLEQTQGQQPGQPPAAPQK